jgi:hypothetical protein
VEFVGLQIECFWLSGRGPCGSGRFVAVLTSFPRVCFSLEFASVESTAGILDEFPELLTQFDSRRTKQVQGVIGVHAQFCKCVPLSAEGKQFKHCSVMRFWEKPIEHGDDALERYK